MDTVIPLSEHSEEHFLGTRHSGQALRLELEDRLTNAQKIVLDFDQMRVTQSFVDELLGVMVLHHGPNLLKRVAFRHCSENTKAIIQFVINSRISDFNSSKKH